MSAGQRPTFGRQLTSLCLLHLSPKGASPDTMGTCSSREIREDPQDQPQAGVAPSPQKMKGTKQKRIRKHLSFFSRLSLSLCFLFCPPGPLLRRGRVSVHKETCDRMRVLALCAHCGFPSLALNLFASALTLSLGLSLPFSRSTIPRPRPSFPCRVPSHEMYSSA